MEIGSIYTTLFRGNLLAQVMLLSLKIPEYPAVLTYYCLPSFCWAKTIVGNSNLSHIVSSAMMYFEMLMHLLHDMIAP